MFKKRCERCDKKIDRKFDYCPYCGLDMTKDKYGMLGKSDDLAEMNNILKPRGIPNLFGGLGGNIMEKMLNNAFRTLAKEMNNINEEEFKQETKQKNFPIASNFQLFINGRRVNLPEFQNNMQENQQQTNQIKKTKHKLPEISPEVLEKSKKLPRKEAKTKLTRLKEKIVYELETPGLDAVENVIINKLEDSYEVKAFAEKTVYYKTLPAKLQLMRYAISPSEGKLFLEFKA